MSKKPSTSVKEIKQIKSALKQNGYFNAVKLCDTLQGSIWKSQEPQTRQPVVIKVTNKKLHSNHVVMIDGKQYYVHENIMKERAILKYLTTAKDSPKEIVKYINWFTCDKNYYLVMENGGHSLFDFVAKAHEYIKIGKVEISEWQKLVQLLFKQMVNTIAYMHEKNVANFDISLENMLVNDIDVSIDEGDNLKFITDDENNPIQMKMCDLGLSELYKNDTNGNPVFTTGKNAGKHNYKSPEMIRGDDELNAASNDIWCLGVSLFMMLIGGSPWERADINDKHFRLIMDGKMMKIIEKWGRAKYLNTEIVDLLDKIFKYEDKRITISELKQHPWLN